MDAQVLKGHLDSLLLAVVAAGPAHGYAIIARLRDRSGGAFDLPEGTVYPALHRLEASGLLKSSWDRSDGRRRRVYAVTPKGRRRLGAQRREWQGFASAVEAVLS
ncbi:MAG TPA: helix-turn-helix transcriptional regulator [Thermoleophilaceae bacterium]